MKNKMMKFAVGAVTGGIAGALMCYFKMIQDARVQYNEVEANSDDLFDVDEYTDSNSNPEPEPYTYTTSYYSAFNQSEEIKNEVVDKLKCGDNNLFYAETTMKYCEGNIVSKNVKYFYDMVCFRSYLCARLYLEGILLFWGVKLREDSTEEVPDGIEERYFDDKWREMFDNYKMLEKHIRINYDLTINDAIDAIRRANKTVQSSAFAYMREMTGYYTERDENGEIRTKYYEIEDADEKNM